MDPGASDCSPRTVPAPTPPSWLTQPHTKLGQFLKYVWKVYGLPSKLNCAGDARRRPTIPTNEVVRSLLFTAFFRLPSLNALEGELGRTSFQRLLGRRATPGQKAYSADTVARVLDSLDHICLRQILRGVLDKAERNKVFREGSCAARRAVALDGWEPFCSYKRQCEHCLVRMVHRGDQLVPQYYHRFVVALLLGPEIDVVLDLESLRTVDMRRAEGEMADSHDGESTAALRLIDRLHGLYGQFIDLFVLDALYPTGPVMTRLTEYGYGAVITVKKQTDEPLKEALALMHGQPPCHIWDDPDKGEHIEAWDVDDLETLDTFSGKSAWCGPWFARPARESSAHGAPPSSAIAPADSPSRPSISSTAHAGISKTQRSISGRSTGTSTTSTATVRVRSSQCSSCGAWPST